MLPGGTLTVPASGVSAPTGLLGSRRSAAPPLTLRTQGAPLFTLPPRKPCPHEALKPTYPLFGPSVIADLIQRRRTKCSLKEVCGDIPFWFLNGYDAWNIDVQDLRVREIKGTFSQVYTPCSGTCSSYYNTRFNNVISKINGDASADFDVDVKILMDVVGTADVKIRGYDIDMTMDIDGEEVPAAQAQVRPTCKFPSPEESRKSLDVEITGRGMASKMTLWTQGSKIQSFLHEGLAESACANVPKSLHELVPSSLDKSLFKPLIARALDSAKRCGHREEWSSDKISPSSQTLSDLLQHRGTSVDVPQFCADLKVTFLHKFNVWNIKLRDLVMDRFEYTITTDSQNRPTLILNVTGLSGSLSLDFDLDIAHWTKLQVSAKLSLKKYWYAISYKVDDASVPVSEAKLYPSCTAASDPALISLETSSDGWGSSAILSLADSYLQDFVHKDLKVAVCDQFPTRLKDLLGL